jgi:hypothetical protein
MQSRATITSEIVSSFPTNNIKYITAQFLRTFQEIMSSSKFNLVDDDLSDIQFSRPDFQAGNALDAIIDLAQLARPIFYVDLKIFEDSATLVSTNFPGLTVSGFGDKVTLNFPSVFAATGASIRKDEFMRSVSDTQIVFEKSNRVYNTYFRFTFYQDIPATSYLISS